MSLKVQDIQDKQFHVRFRGFDMEEVDSFLELVVENFSGILEDNKELTRKVSTLTEELEQVKKQESSFRSAIISAKKISDELINKSKSEAAALLENGHEEVKLLKDEAHREVAELEGRVDELRGMQAEFEKDLHEVILSYQEKLKFSPGRDECIEQTEVQADRITLTNEAASSAEKPDLSDLYEKIDLGDNLGGGESLLSGDIDDLAVEGDYEKESKCIPDLDSDIVFTLHDPLDDDESLVDVAIKREMME